MIVQWQVEVFWEGLDHLGFCWYNLYVLLINLIIMYDQPSGSMSPTYAGSFFLLINYGLISLINPQVEIVTVMSHYAIESSPIGQSLRPIITISTVWFKHAAT